LAERPSSDPSTSADKASSGAPGESSAGDSAAPRGLGEQFGRTRSAFLGLIAAHIDLLKAELGEIMGQVKKALALAGCAFGLILLTVMLLGIGTWLWLDDWVFGSIGWGVLHGSLAMIALAVTLVLLIFPHGGRRLALGYVLALIVAAVAAAILLEVTNFTWGVSIALSLTLFLIVVPVLGAFLVLRHADMEALKDRFIPKQTIETTKETVEWVREQMPLGRKS
jgi:hypothetical protein